MAASPDLVVVGAGTMGAWAARLAQRGGRGTTLVDAYGAGHARASSGGETRILRSSHGPDELYTRWARAAREAWIGLGEEIAEPVFVEAGCLWFGRRGDGFETESAMTLERLSIPVERLSPMAVRERWPHVKIGDDELAVFEPEAGFVFARRAVAAVAGSVVASGGRFELGAVRPGRSKGGRLQDVVSADGARLGAAQFVFACGPWLPRLFPDLLGDVIRVTKQDVFFVGPRGGDGRFAAEWTPAWVDYDAAFYGIPAADGRGFKLAPDRPGPIFDPTAGDRMVDPESARLARGYLARRFPDLAAQPFVETRVCQYESTPDTHFLIDRHPDWSNVWLVGGGSGHGFKHGPAIGAAVLRRLDGEPIEAEEERFLLARRRSAEAGVRTAGDTMARDWQGY
ncbi:MAG TPA: FAD-dependent oxidoreductase [Candidatus Limnocylindrales bacterium]|nr:FAD-dependent oxidoreductase [Candidatus Limnocylindrales bacterium]